MNTTAKGSRWRKVVQDYLDDMGFVTKPRAWMVPGDDIVATQGHTELSVEAKDHKAITLAAFVDQAERQALPGQHPVVVIKRKGKTSADDAYVVMSGRAFRRLMGGS